MKLKRSLTLFASVLVSWHAPARGSACDVKLANQVANCISAKSNFLATRNLTSAGATIDSARGTVGVTQLRKNFADYLNTNREEIIKLGAAPYSKQVSENLNTNSKKYFQIALEETIEQLKQGKPLDHAWKLKTGTKIHDAWLANNPWAITDPTQGKSFSEMIKISKNAADLRLRKEASANILRNLKPIEAVSEALTESTKNKGANALIKLTLGRMAASDLAKATGAILGPVFGAGMMALELGGDTAFDPSTCLKENAQLPNVRSDEIPGQDLRVRDIINISFTRGCYPKKPEFTTDDRVLKFLISSDEEKEAALKVPEVCEFYKGLQNSTCSHKSVETSTAECSAEDGRATLLLADKSAQKTKIEVSFDAMGNIKNIRGPDANGYAFNRESETWIAYSVPLGLRRGVEIPPTAWVKYDGIRSSMAGSQKKIFESFENSTGWDIAANFGAIESFVNNCTNPQKSGHHQNTNTSKTAQ